MVRGACLLLATVGAVTVQYDNKAVQDVTKLPKVNDFQGTLELVSGTRTSDSLRYRHGLPLTTTFTDTHNHKWAVSLSSSADELTLFFPCSEQVIWHGDETDRTGFDAQCRMCEVNFRYDAGIRLTAKCYALSNIGYRISGGYDDVMDKVMKGISAAAAIGALIAAESLASELEAAVKVQYDGKVVQDVTKLPNVNDFQGTLELVSGTRTYDTLRYRHGFPLTTTFTDTHNHKWAVSLISSADELTLFFPCSEQVIWHGDETDRTGFDAQCRMCEVNFRYDAGIRLTSKCFALSNIGYRISGGYDDVMDKVMKGINAAQAIKDLIDTQSVEGMGDLTDMPVVAGNRTDMPVV